MMLTEKERMIVKTDDGSHTIFIPQLHISYHSKFGAVQESKCIYIEAGLSSIAEIKNSIHILEIGFGTGLNAMLSLEFALQHQKNIFYSAVEKYPLQMPEVNQLNYSDVLNNRSLQLYFINMHECNWEQNIAICTAFTLHKIKTCLLNFNATQQYDLVYFDAFDPNAQPELWTENIFKQLFKCLNKNSVLVTYSSKGKMRRRLQAAGFSVQKLKGPKGKREIIRAIKN